VWRENAEWELFLIQTIFLLRAVVARVGEFDTKSVGDVTSAVIPLVTVKTSNANSGNLALGLRALQDANEDVGLKC